MNKLILILVLGLTGLLQAALVNAGETFAPGGVALEGYDPVAYFVDGRAVRGKKKFALEQDGVMWRFSNAQNMDLFKVSPADYMPQFGGYCAFGVAARQRLIRSDPTVFDIVDGKLYLNFSERLRDRWARNRDRMIDRGHASWPRLGE